MKKCKWWDVVDELPQGWKIDKTAGSPLARSVFITNGKSVISGKQERKILLVQPQEQYRYYETAHQTDTQNERQPAAAKQSSAERDSIIAKDIAKPLNNLARRQMQLKLLRDISADMVICEIEGWSKKEYLKELQELINSFSSKEVSSK